MRSIPVLTFVVLFLSVIFPTAGSSQEVLKSQEQSKSPQLWLLKGDGEVLVLPTPTPLAGEITITLPGGVPLVMVRIPAGSFLMGSQSSESGRYSNEGPAHTVHINYDFYMGKTEITQAQWLAVMQSWPGTAPNSPYGVGDNYPAYYISWNDCQNFINALNQQGQGTFRLPSEAEWEYAYRSGSTTRFYFGDSNGCGTSCEDCAAGTLPGNRSDYMWYCGNNSPYGSKEVGQLTPNDFGLYDRHGNVWEW